MPHEISSPLHFRTLLSGHTYLLADFYATWCPPCKTISPIFNSLSNSNTLPGKLGFVKINVDEQPEVAAPYGIRSIPTFILFKNGKVVETIQGADVGGLKRLVEGVRGEIGKVEEEERVKEKKVEEVKKEGGEEVEEKSVSGSYGMTGGSNWKMSLN